MINLYERWKAAPAAIRKPFVLIIGSTVVFTGVAMLVLPGPGWAAIFMGFAILATEFAFAERVRDWFIAELKIIGDSLLQRWRGFWRRFKHKLK